MVQVNYIEGIDELEIVFKEVDIPEVVKISNGITFEFDSEDLSAIILPNFGKMIHFNELSDASIEFDSFSEQMLKINLNGQIISIKINLDELENQ